MCDKIWKGYEIADLGDGFSLLHVDRHLLHDGSGPVLARLRASGGPLAQPDLCFATLDQVVSTAPCRPATSESRNRAIASLREGVAEAGIRLFDVGRSGHGIVQVSGPELGISRQPPEPSLGPRSREDSSFWTARKSSSAETGPAFKSGVLGVVRAGGPVVAGDSARIRLSSSSFRPLPAL